MQLFCYEVNLEFELFAREIELFDQDDRFILTESNITWKINSYSYGGRKNRN